MSKKSVRILAMALIVALLLSTTAAFAAPKSSNYRLNTCGDKLFGRKTTLYIKNTSPKLSGKNSWGTNGWIVATVKTNRGCGANRSTCVIPRGQTGIIKLTTRFGTVGDVRINVSPNAMSLNYSCSLWNSDGRPIFKVN